MTPDGLPPSELVDCQGHILGSSAPAFQTWTCVILSDAIVSSQGDDVPHDVSPKFSVQHLFSTLEKQMYMVRIEVIWPTLNKECF